MNVSFMSANCCARRTHALSLRICPTVGLGMHCCARRTWQLRSGLVCPANQLPCCVVGRWLWVSNGVAKSSAFALRLVLACFTSAAFVFLHYGKIRLLFEPGVCEFSAAQDPFPERKPGTQPFDPKLVVRGYGHLRTVVAF